MIWRRLLLLSDHTIADLHYTIQIAMGWDDFHLHQFLIRGKRYGVSRVYGPDFDENGRNVPLQVCPWLYCRMGILAATRWPPNGLGWTVATSVPAREKI
jgi:hypothetical protein